ncbi:MAG: pyridoxal phosphate-dependent aminotransferase [Deltaproteobacteria bacterium]|jgi:cystathionine beta-lyase|nr:pyridoxal phosphate-dependent aminotransferase [Deltaproteobacteria bacterium]
MPYNFDEIIPRKGTNCIKYDFAKERGMPEDLLPMWVADMDFRTPKEVIEALIKVASHGIFGYSEAKDDYFLAVRNWFATRFGFEPQREWLKKTPGVVYALNTAIKAFTKEGDGVLIQSPVYYPFFSGIKNNQRTLVDSPLRYENGRYSIDFADFEEKLKTSRAKLFLLCSPHNPVGRVWSREELLKLGQLCLKYNCLVLSDEIHCDFVFEGYRHLVFNTVDPRFNDITILCTAPSKTFNLAGLMISNVFIANRETKQLFAKEMERTGLSQLSVMGLAANTAAYQYGAGWLSELLAYLQGNLATARSFIQKELKGVSLVEPEGTYLLWLDFKALGRSHEEINDLIVHKAKLWLDEGLIFGENGRYFQRINIACPRSVLEEALAKLKAALFG